MKFLLALTMLVSTSAFASNMKMKGRCARQVAQAAAMGWPQNTMVHTFSAKETTKSVYEIEVMVLEAHAGPGEEFYATLIANVDAKCNVVGEITYKK